MTNPKHPLLSDWQAFCQALADAGEEVFAANVPDNEQVQAEGVRYLSRMARAALEWYVEYNDPAFPVLYRPAHETIKLGADNPDNVYLKAVLDGQYDYVITGTRGTVDYISFSTSKGSYADNFKQIETGFLDGNDLEVLEDGRFEIIVSSREHTGNWLRAEGDSQSLLVRQTYKDRAAETAADLSIRRRDQGPAPVPLNAKGFGADLGKATAFFTNTVALFARWSEQIQEHPNQLPLWDQAFCQSVGGDPNITYYHGYFKLLPNEALLIEISHIPPCKTWNIQIDNYWMESLDYRYHRVSLNAHTAKPNPDGSITLVLSPEDNGHPNWLSTAGHHEGSLCFRWVGARELVHPATKHIALQDAPVELHTAS